MQLKISVIIVVLNGAKTIKKAISSVLSQTFTNFEIIVADGGSVDGTIEILKEFKENNFHWKSKPDNGIYDAMNKSIKNSSGEWLFFLGADDSLYDVDVFYKMFNNKANNACDFLYGNVYSVAQKKKYDGKFNNNKILFSNICHQSIFYKKRIFDELGYYNDDYKIFADWDFNIKCFFDQNIKKKYVDIIIANFSGTGISTINADLFFLRDYLFSRNLEFLKKENKNKLYNIVFYDKWWRLIRSLKLTQKDDDISNYTQSSIPLDLYNMYLFQKRLSNKIIHIGIFSKFFMCLSYFINLSGIGLKKNGN